MYSTNSISTMDTSMLAGADADMLTTMMATLGSVLAVFAVIMLVVAIILIIAYWKMFKKAGQPGWAAIVPFYSSIILSKVAGVNIWFYLGILIATVVGNFVPFIATLVAIANIVFIAVIAFKLPGKFGKGVGFGFGLWLLPVIFYPILAFGKSEYQG